jgi:hypothetical protein
VLGNCVRARLALRLYGRQVAVYRLDGDGYRIVVTRGGTDRVRLEPFDAILSTAWASNSTFPVPVQKQRPTDRSSASLVSIGRQHPGKPAARRRSLSASGAFAQERSELTDDAHVQAA